MAGAAVVAALAGSTIAAPAASAGIGCGADTVGDNVQITVMIQRAVFSCDVVNFGVRGGRGIGAGGMKVLLWGPDGIRTTVTVHNGEYVNGWSGDEPRGGLWCGKELSWSDGECVRA